MSLSERPITPSQRLGVLIIAGVLWLLGVAAVAHVLQPIIYGQDRVATIQRSTDGEQFFVTFTKGALNVCTVYEDQRVLAETDPLRENFPGGHYAPRHCWMVGPDVTTYVDNWDYIRPENVDWHIYVEAQYDIKEPQTFVVSNRVRVKR